MGKLQSMDGKGIFFLALYQLLGGLYGFFLSVNLFISLPPFSFVTDLLVLIALLLYGFSIYCGVLLFQQKERGLLLSRINQCLQLAGFYVLGYGFSYIAGFFISINLNFTEGIGISFNFGSSAWQINFHQQSDEITFGFNVLALLIIFFINTTLKKVKEEKEDLEFKMFGADITAGNP